MWSILIASALIGLSVSGVDGLVFGPLIGLAVMLVLLWISKLFPDDKSQVRAVRKRDVKNLPDYQNGHEYEYFVAAYLKKNGFTDVRLTPGSGDYGADVLCTSPKGLKLAVQCKLYQRPVGYKAVEEAISGMHYYKCDAAVVITNNTYTQQARQAAKRMGVVLMERVF